MKTPKIEQRGTPIQIDPQKGETIEMKVIIITHFKSLRYQDFKLELS